MKANFTNSIHERQKVNTNDTSTFFLILDPLGFTIKFILGTNWYYLLFKTVSYFVKSCRKTLGFGESPKSKTIKHFCVLLVIMRCSHGYFKPSWGVLGER